MSLCLKENYFYLSSTPHTFSRRSKSHLSCFPFSNSLFIKVEAFLASKPFCYAPTILWICCLSYWGICQFNHFCICALTETLNWFVEDLEDLWLLEVPQEYNPTLVSVFLFLEIPKEQKWYGPKGKINSRLFFQCIKQMKITSDTVAWKGLQD